MGFTYSFNSVNQKEFFVLNYTYVCTSKSALRQYITEVTTYVKVFLKHSFNTHVAVIIIIEIKNNIIVILVI